MDYLCDGEQDDDGRGERESRQAVERVHAHPDQPQYRLVLTDLETILVRKEIGNLAPSSQGSVKSE